MSYPNAFTDSAALVLKKAFENVEPSVQNAELELLQREVLGKTMSFKIW
jgi:hypothetical protein